MSRRADDDEAELPDGVVPLPREPVDPRAPGGCGFTGCAYTLVAFFAILLVVMVGILLYRITQTPPPPMPPR
jgi:hypothetical protein